MRASFFLRTASAPFSQYHRDHPYMLQRQRHGVSGGLRAGRIHHRPLRRQLNWRGPIWFPVNFLLIESLQKFHHYLGEDFKVECPTGSGQYDDACGRWPANCRAA